ncbi:MAG TPA: mannose-1-phosphate guanylyltransferase/mannose-6-phosphate isomerase, partial [Alphaproteobacteria bacterium]|nr:mannose-1-phosphate guanylyltransferase/mannose-6-phosphate isomerase [Alphaproteobacteria bacterium]
MLKALLLCGGTGSRLWPLSRQLNPKQFLKLTSTSSSMVQRTVERLSGIDIQGFSLICNEEHRFLAAEQLRVSGNDDADIILEPAGRNTAPAIALASIRAIHNSEDPVLLVLAADHMIENTHAFHEQVLKAFPLAEAGKLITFGVVPGHAETGYGYIHRGQAVNEDAFSVARFVEKPDQETAEGYVASGEYFWNSGMFMFRASR